jgi:hypothetical protein
MSIKAACVPENTKMRKSMTRDKDRNPFTPASGDPSRRAFGGFMGAGALIVAGCGGGGDGAAGPSDPPPAVTPPQITAQPAAPQVNQQGQTARFSVQASGDGLRYQWRRNGVDIAGANASVYERVAQAADDGAQFSVVVSNSAGSVTSNAVGLSIGLSFNVAAAV